MTVGKRVGRRGSGSGGFGRRHLAERERELALLRRLLTDAGRGAGGVVVIESPAGTGRTSLLETAGELADRAGMQVLRGHGTAVECEFPFATAIRLFESAGIPDDLENQRRFRGPARRAGEVLAGATVDGAVRHQEFELIRGFHALIANLVTGDEGSAAAPLAMFVDDAHWADASSLRLLAYLADGLGELPIALVVAITEGEETADPVSLVAVRRAAGGHVMRPEPISEDGVVAIVRATLPEAEPELCSACAELTAGNPFLLVRLLEMLRAQQQRPNAATVARLDGLTPGPVVNAVMGWFTLMPVPVRSLAVAVAVLGDAAPLSLAARVARLDPGQAGDAADLLAAKGLLHPGVPLRFVHPLIRSTLYASIPALDRSRAHRAAAEILYEADAPADQIAAHLLQVPGESDPRAVRTLRSAASEALERTGPATAARLLERALEEPPAPGLRTELLAELAEAESLAGLPQAVERLQQAIDVTRDAPRRAELELSRGQALCELGRQRDAADVFRVARLQLGGDHAAVADELDTAYIGAASLVPELSEHVRVDADELLERIDGSPTAGQRRTLAQLAMHAAVSGRGAERTIQLVDRAWEGGSLLRVTSPAGSVWQLLAGALLIVDQVEQCLELCDEVSSAARFYRLAPTHAAVSHWRAWCLYTQGRVAEAVDEAYAAMDVLGGQQRSYLRSATAVLASCQCALGQLEMADRTLSKMEDPVVVDRAAFPLLLCVRAQLRLAQRRPREALSDALAAGRRAEAANGLAGPGAIAWRSTAALALGALGDTTRARELASAELELARRAGVPRVQMRALRALGLAERGERTVQRLAEAVELGDRQPERIEHIEVLIELGAALRRKNQRKAARGPLLRALEEAAAGGASALSERARAELASTGAQVDRATLTGVGSLTPGERRVADVAGKGLTTRQIAQELFVTPKTVEFHLRQIYRKLEISSRPELLELLAAEPPNQ